MPDHEFHGDTASTWSDNSVEEKKWAPPKPKYPGNFRTVDNNETIAMQRSLSSYINSPTGKIIVGAKEYHVHSKLLKEKMPMLFLYLDEKVLRTKTCCVEEWGEAVFDQIVLWLYQGRLEVPARAGLMGYTDVYRFATRFESEVLQNHVVDAIRKYCRDFQVSQYIIQNYAGMLGDHIGGQMSKFLIDQLAYEMVFYGNGYESTGSKDDFEVFFERDPKTAVTLTFTLRRFHERESERRSTKPCEALACKYHTYTKTPSCKSTSTAGGATFKGQANRPGASTDGGGTWPTKFTTRSQPADVEAASAGFAANCGEITEAKGSGTSPALSSYSATLTSSATRVDSSNGWDSSGSTHPQKW